MKKMLVLLLILPLLFSNCNKDDKVLFELAYTDDFVIPAGLNPFDTHYFILRDIPIGTYFTSNNIDPNDLRSIEPKSARFINIFAGNGNYDFIQEADVRIFTDDENNSTEVFWRNPVPIDTGDELGLVPSTTDAKPFMLNSKFSLKIRLRLRAAPQQTLDTRFRFDFNVK